VTTYDIAVVGGTGPQGKALAYRWALQGHRVVLGSRSAQRAERAADEIRQRVEPAHLHPGEPARLHPGEPARLHAGVTGAANHAAAAGAGVVLIAVPYAGHRELVTSLAEDLAGKTVISCVNPLGFDKEGPYALDVPSGSAAEETADLVPGASVVGAFHHVSAVSLWKGPEYLEHEDVLVCGDEPEPKAVAIELARAVTGRDGVDAGRLRMARQLEPLTAVLISINKRYRTRSGIRVSGLPR
jgi:8-hydroxy-5-deazaflavin:NADPH oxidoreductase